MSKRSSRPVTELAAEIDTESILESISDGVFTVDERWRVMSFNRAAEQITGVLREEAIGCRCSEVFTATSKEEPERSPMSSQPKVRAREKSNQHKENHHARRKQTGSRRSGTDDR